jgi:hypothetical protein
VSSYTYQHDPRISGADFEQDEEEYCSVCGGPMEWVDCWKGCDDGEWDLYEANPNEYEPGEVQTCDGCEGQGGYLECISLPHEGNEVQR